MHRDVLTQMEEPVNVRDDPLNRVFPKVHILRHIGLLEADEDKIRKIRPKGTQVRMLYVPREAIRP